MTLKEKKKNCKGKIFEKGKVFNGYPCEKFPEYFRIFFCFRTFFKKKYFEKKNAFFGGMFF